MVWLATARLDVETLAVPPALSVCGVPMVVAPSLNVTVPPGVPVAGATVATVAVKVTDWPNTDGLAGEAVTVVVVEAWPTA